MVLRQLGRRGRGGRGSHEVSLGVASHQLMIAMALRERLPGWPRCSRPDGSGADCVDDRVPHGVDRRPAGPREGRHHVGRGRRRVGCAVEAKVEQGIDYWVDRYDPDALRRMEHRARNRHVDKTSDGCGTSTIEAVLLDHDAAAVDAPPGCDGPRGVRRRSTHAGSASRRRIGRDRARRRTPVCQCGSDDCDAAGVQPNAVVINVIAEETTLTDDTPVHLDGENPDKPTKPVREMTLAEASVSRRPTARPTHRRR